MKRIGGTSFIRWFALVALLLFSSASAQANPMPISGPSAPVFRTGFPILMEAVCVALLLRRFRTPPYLVMWILGMHLLTYPLFIVFCFGPQVLSQGLHFIFFGTHPFPGNRAVIIAEAAIALIEGGVIYLLCRLIPSEFEALPVPSVGRAISASAAGNVCSIALSLVFAWLMDPPTL